MIMIKALDEFWTKQQLLDRKVYVGTSAIMLLRSVIADVPTHVRFSINKLIFGSG